MCIKMCWHIPYLIVSFNRDISLLSKPTRTAKARTLGLAIKITAEQQPWKSTALSSFMSQEAPQRDTGKASKPMRTSPLRQVGGDPTEPLNHGSFTQFWVTQPVALTSSLSRFMTHSSFCAPSMNSDKDIWPVVIKHDQHWWLHGMMLHTIKYIHRETPWL